MTRATEIKRKLNGGSFEMLFTVTTVLLGTSITHIMNQGKAVKNDKNPLSLTKG